MRRGRLKRRIWVSPWYIILKQDFELAVPILCAKWQARSRLFETYFREAISNQVTVKSLRRAMRNFDVATGRQGFHPIMNQILYSYGQ